VAMEETVALVEVALVVAETSTAMMATVETTATLEVWTGGATSRHRNRLLCQPHGNHMLTLARQ